MNILEIMERFMLTPAPSGYEKEMADKLLDALDNYADQVSIDRIGNVIAKIEGTDDSSPAVMVYAHMDQLGFIIRRIESDGFVQVDRLGGIPEKVLPGLKLEVRSRDGRFYPAVIGTKSHHAASEEEKYRVDPVTSLFLDLGAVSAEQVRCSGIEIGCPAVYSPAFEQLSDTIVSGTSVDNRGGCAGLVHIASLLSAKTPRSNVYLVGTVWEEFNLRGAMMAARTIKPDIAIGLDVVLAGDTPDLKNKYETKLGMGPVVTMYTFHGRGSLNGTLPHEGLVKLAIKTAVDEGIPLQHFAALGILTDSSYLQLENTGVASIEMGYPARYTHSPVELCNVTDIENLGKVIFSIIGRIDKGFNLNRY